MERGSRYEILPFGAGAEEAAALTEPVTLTVTCSPRHGLDKTVEVAESLRGHGHTIIPHVPAKMVRDREHLDEVLRRFAEAGIDEIFLVGGDAPEPHGPFDSAVQLLPAIHEHPQRPKRIGIGAYPEGHPLIDPEALKAALGEKSELADYVVTQMCFDADLLIDWIREVRADGLTLPIYIGIPGAVDRRKLLEISMKVGVGQSVSFLRKQRGLRRLFTSPLHATAKLYDALAPRVGDPKLGIAGFHWYTFNRLADTVAWEQERAPAVRAAS
jgi:methylenetetrahydrofolate reductase (NADPH)